MKKLLLGFSLFLIPSLAGAVCLFDSDQMTAEQITAAKFACTTQNIEKPCTNTEAISFFQDEIKTVLIGNYLDIYRESQARKAEVKDRFKKATKSQKCSALQALGYTQAEAEDVLGLSAGECS